MLFHFIQRDFLSYLVCVFHNFFGILQFFLIFYISLFLNLFINFKSHSINCLNFFLFCFHGSLIVLLIINLIYFNDFILNSCSNFISDIAGQITHF